MLAGGVRGHPGHDQRARPAHPLLGSHLLPPPRQLGRRGHHASPPWPRRRRGISTVVETSSSRRVRVRADAVRTAPGAPPLIFSDHALWPARMPFFTIMAYPAVSGQDRPDPADRSLGQCCLARPVPDTGNGGLSEVPAEQVAEQPAVPCDSEPAQVVNYGAKPNIDSCECDRFIVTSTRHARANALSRRQGEQESGRNRKHSTTTQYATNERPRTTAPTTNWVKWTTCPLRVTPCPKP